MAGRLLDFHCWLQGPFQAPLYPYLLLGSLTAQIWHHILYHRKLTTPCISKTKMICCLTKSLHLTPKPKSLEVASLRCESEFAACSLGLTQGPYDEALLLLHPTLCLNSSDPEPQQISPGRGHGSPGPWLCPNRHQSLGNRIRAGTVSTHSHMLQPFNQVWWTLWDP